MSQSNIPPTGKGPPKHASASYRSPTSSPSPSAKKSSIAGFDSPPTKPKVSDVVSKFEGGGSDEDKSYSPAKPAIGEQRAKGRTTLPGLYAPTPRPAVETLSRNDTLFTTSKQHRRRHSDNVSRRIQSIEQQQQKTTKMTTSPPVLAKAPQHHSAGVISVVSSQKKTSDVQTLIVKFNDSEATPAWPPGSNSPPPILLPTTEPPSDAMFVLSSSPSSSSSVPNSFPPAPSASFSSFFSSSYSFCPTTPLMSSAAASSSSSSSSSSSYSLSSPSSSSSSASSSMTPSSSLDQNGHQRVSLSSFTVSSKSPPSSTSPPLPPRANGGFLTWSSPSEEEIELVQKLWTDAYVKHHVEIFQRGIQASELPLPQVVYRKESHSSPDGACSYCGCKNFKANFFNPTFCSFCFHIHPPAPDSQDEACDSDIDDMPSLASLSFTQSPSTPQRSPLDEAAVKIFETASPDLPDFSIERAKDQVDVVNMTTAFLLQAKSKEKRTNIDTGGERIRGELVGPNAINIAAVVLDNEDGSYLVMFSTAVAGVYTLRLLVKDPSAAQSLPIGPPIHLNFLPGEISPERCFAVGKGIWGFSTQNMVEAFVLIARDRFGNRRAAEEGDFSVYLSNTPDLSVTQQLEAYRFHPTDDDTTNINMMTMMMNRGGEAATTAAASSSSSSSASASSSSSSSDDRLPSPRKPSRYSVVVAGIGDMTLSYDQECEVAYRFYGSRSYYVHILCNTKDSQQAIPGSPFLIQCSIELVSELFMPHEMENFRITSTLDRRSTGLPRFPMEILQLTKLQRIYLSDNQLRSVPQGICMLTELIELDLSRNELKDIPPQIGELPRLRSLVLSRNKIEQLPPEIGSLSNLSMLDVSFNQLRELPFTFVRLKELSDLQLHGNPLISPPLEICELGIQMIFDHFENMAPSVSAPFDVKMRWLLPQLRKFSVQDQGFVVIQIFDRKTLFNESMLQLIKLSPTEMRKPIKVVFVNEQAIDLGGPRREWFRSFCRAMVDQDLGLFESFDEGRTFQPHPLSDLIHPITHITYFQIFGRVVARAVQDKTPIDCHFTRSLYNSLLRREWQSELNSIDEFQLVNPSLYASMIKPLLMNDVSVTPGFNDIPFSWESRWGKETQHEATFTLGRVDPNTKVTEENKWNFAQQFCRSRMYLAIQKQLQAFVNGFNEVLPRELVSCFKPRELESLICGFERVDVQDLQNNTFIDVSSQIEDPATLIMWYWEAIHSFSQLDLSKLMQFVTGSSQVPVGGFARLKPRFTIDFQYYSVDDGFPRREMPLPTASTCFNTLRIPSYTSQAQLYEKLRMAIHESLDYFGQC